MRFNALPVRTVLPRPSNNQEFGVWRSCPVSSLRTAFFAFVKMVGLVIGGASFHESQVLAINSVHRNVSPALTTHYLVYVLPEPGMVSVGGTVRRFRAAGPSCS